MQYVALDFETANNKRSSACSIGLAFFNNGKCLDTYYSLIRPKELYFNPYCSAVHKLSHDQIAAAPTMLDIWPKIEAFIDSKPLVAHNAAFDMSVLKASCLDWNIKLPNYEYYCSLCLAKQILHGEENYKLSTLVSKYLCFTFDHHNAAADAFAAGKLFDYLTQNCSGRAKNLFS